MFLRLQAPVFYPDGYWEGSPQIGVIWVVCALELVFDAGACSRLVVVSPRDNRFQGITTTVQSSAAVPQYPGTMIHFAPLYVLLCLLAL